MLIARHKFRATRTTGSVEIVFNVVLRLFNMSSDATGFRTKEDEVSQSVSQSDRQRNRQTKSLIDRYTYMQRHSDRQTIHRSSG